jgi:putative endonuclease
MFSGRITHATLRALDWLSAKTLPQGETKDGIPPHLRTGRRGEEAAYFYLRRRGYTIIARNYRSPNHRGELDLVGWDGDILCFIEVKTRTTRAVIPAEAAVDAEKRRELRLVAHEFLRHLPDSRQSAPGSERSSRDVVESRFDVLAVYYDRGVSRPSFELLQNAFPLAYNRKFRLSTERV